MVISKKTIKTLRDCCPMLRGQNQLALIKIISSDFSLYCFIVRRPKPTCVDKSFSIELKFCYITHTDKELHNLMTLNFSYLLGDIDSLSFCGLGNSFVDLPIGHCVKEDFN